MRIQADENGFMIKTLLKTVSLPYKDVRSIVVETPKKTVIRSFEKEEYVDTTPGGFTFSYPTVMDMIVMYNIYFRNETAYKESGEDFILGKEEKDKYLSSMVEGAREEARNMVKEQLGPKFDLDLRILEIHQETILCFILLRNGNVVTDMPECIRQYGDEEIPASFDVLTLADLCFWDNSSRSGKYLIITSEDLEAGEIKDCIVEKTDMFCYEYLGVNSREYLDQLP